MTPRDAQFFKKKWGKLFGEKTYRRKVKIVLDELLEKELIADLPIEIVRPVVINLYNRFRLDGPNLKFSSNSKYPGISAMSKRFNISSSILIDIMKGDRKKVSLTHVEKLTNESEYDLNTLYEETKEWARENPSRKWPDKY